MNAIKQNCHRYYIETLIKKDMEIQKRTEQEWRALYDAAVTSIIGGRCSNGYYGDYSIESIVSEAIRGGELLIKELKEKEEAE